MTALPLPHHSPTDDTPHGHLQGHPHGDVPSASHFVQFYETDDFLEVAVADFLVEGLVEGQAAVVIATPAHRVRFLRRLKSRGVNVERVQRNGLLTMLDARSTLECFMRDGVPDQTLFREVVGPVVDKAAKAGKHPIVRAYGEMVDLLWEDGESDAALRLEEHWNVLAETHAFSLLCAYRMGHFLHAGAQEGLQAVCGAHAHVLPSEPTRNTQTTDSAAHVRVAILEERARTLEAEIAHRRSLESRLRNALNERKQVEEALRRREFALAEAERLAEIGSWTTDHETSETIWSAGLHLIAGRDVAMAPPHAGELGAILVHDDAMRYRRALDEAIRERRALVDLEVHVIRPNGDIRTCALSAHAEFNDEDHAVVVNGTLRDLTDLRAREAREHSAQRLESLGLLAGGIAHDFNNLLSPILIDAEQLVDELETDSEPYLLAKEIALAARHAGALTHQLLAYAGRGQFVRTNVRLDAMAEEIALLLHTALPAGASLKLDIQPVPFVHGDRAQLTQVVLNLVKNAADSLQEKAGEVEVSVREHADATTGKLGVLLEVRDTGSGMSPDVVARMFDPFFTTKAVGHGLGLSATLGVVKAHQGRISVDSMKGVGSTIRVWLPAVDDGQNVALSTSGEHAVPERAATVVIADDEPSMRRILARQLGRAGYKVLQAEHGREALDLLAAHHGEVDLALLDVTMPVMGGVATMRAIQEQFPNVKPVLMSGYTDSPIDSSLEHPNTWFIAKPFGVADLHRLLDRVRNEQLIY